MEILAEVGEVDASLLVSQPLLEVGSGVDLAEAEHGGGITAAGKLQAVCSFRIEVKAVRLSLTASTTLDEVVPQVDVRISPELSLDGIKRLVLLL